VFRRQVKAATRVVLRGNPMISRGAVGRKVDLVYVRLVFTLWRQEPCCCAEHDDDYEADKRRPSAGVSFEILLVLSGAFTRSPLCTLCMYGRAWSRDGMRSFTGDEGDRVVTCVGL
jgi:hypothetical protein